MKEAFNFWGGCYILPGISYTHLWGRVNSQHAIRAYVPWKYQDKFVSTLLWSKLYKTEQKGWTESDSYRLAFRAYEVGKESQEILVKWMNTKVEVIDPPKVRPIVWSTAMSIGAASGYALYWLDVFIRSHWGWHLLPFPGY